MGSVRKVCFEMMGWDARATVREGGTSSAQLVKFLEAESKGRRMLVKQGTDASAWPLIPRPAPFPNPAFRQQEKKNAVVPARG
jgi:hypothetical protein